jgi:sugar phosphate isomerase/epimerase
MTDRFTRREMIATATLSLGAAAAATSLSPAAAAESAPAEPFRYCLNSGTIRGQKLSLVEEFEVAAKAGYSGIEPWTRSIQQYVEEGGSLADAKRRLDDLGLTLEDAIGFPAWSVDDEAKRAEGVEQLKREMDMVARLGGRLIAAPPAGSNRTPGMDLFKIAERYRAILEVGRQIGVAPQLEIWGSSLVLSRIGEAVLVASEAGHPDAGLLLDAYHIYRGGSSFEGLRLINGAALHVFHVNDYPGEPLREQLTDGDRVYPGDGVAPLPHVLQILYETGFRGAVSLELFNRDYWQQDPLVVARTGLEKTRAVVAKAMAGE